MPALIEARLALNDYLAGSAFTPAGIMSAFSLTTMRLLLPVSSCFFLLISRHIRTYWSIFSGSVDGPDINGRWQKAIPT